MNRSGPKFDGNDNKYVMIISYIMNSPKRLSQIDRSYIVGNQKRPFKQFTTELFQLRNLSQDSRTKHLSGESVLVWVREDLCSLYEWWKFGFT